MILTKTQYITVDGIAYWCKPYHPDEFRGAVRWGVDLVVDEANEKKMKEYGIQKVVKKTENGNTVKLYRPTTKMMKGRLVHFTPPIIYDKDGGVLVAYYDDQNQFVRSYDNADQKIIKKGENVLIGNGSKIQVTLSIYPTSMGNGNRLESIKILDLIEYKAPEVAEAEVAQNAPKIAW